MALANEFQVPFVAEQAIHLSLRQLSSLCKRGCFATNDDIPAQNILSPNQIGNLIRRTRPLNFSIHHTTSATMTERWSRRQLVPREMVPLRARSRGRVRWHPRGRNNTTARQPQARRLRHVTLWALVPFATYLLGASPERVDMSQL